MCSCDNGYYSDLYRHECYDSLIGERMMVVVIALFLITLLSFLLIFLLIMITANFVYKNKRRALGVH